MESVHNFMLVVVQQISIVRDLARQINQATHDSTLPTVDAPQLNAATEQCMSVILQHPVAKGVMRELDCNRCMRAQDVNVLLPHERVEAPNPQDDVASEEVEPSPQPEGSYTTRLVAGNSDSDSYSLESVSQAPDDDANGDKDDEDDNDHDGAPEPHAVAERELGQFLELLTPLPVFMEPKVKACGQRSSSSSSSSSTNIGYISPSNHDYLIQRNMPLPPPPPAKRQRSEIICPLPAPKPRIAQKAMPMIRLASG